MPEQDHLKELAHIRGIMDRSTRFLSLSGLSGVIAGVLALFGAFAAHRYMTMYMAVHDDPLTYASMPDDPEAYWAGVGVLVGIALVVLVLALTGAFWFTWRRSRRLGQSLYDAAARRLMVNMLIPLGSGGIFCLALLWYGLPGLVPPATLVFYGLALVNGSKYTLDEVRWLGLSQLALGLIASFWVGAGLLFWALGFGVLHIFYGALMYLRHEREGTVSERA